MFFSESKESFIDILSVTKIFKKNVGLLFPSDFHFVNSIRLAGLLGHNVSVVFFPHELNGKKQCSKPCFDFGIWRNMISYFFLIILKSY